jgi:hypothetical protein
MFLKSLDSGNVSEELKFASFLDAVASAALVALMAYCGMYDVTNRSIIAISEVALQHDFCGIKDCLTTCRRLNKPLKFVNYCNSSIDQCSLNRVIQEGMPLTVTFCLLDHACHPSISVEALHEQRRTWRRAQPRCKPTVTPSEALSRCSSLVAVGRM